MGSRVELFEAIRRDHRRGELSIRELAARHDVHRRTVRQASESAEPPPRKVPEQPPPAAQEQEQEQEERVNRKDLVQHRR